MEQITVSKNRFFLIVAIIAILNPIFPGLLLGLAMLFHPELRREGVAVTVFSIIWGAIALTLVSRFRHLFV